MTILASTDRRLITEVYWSYIAKHPAEPVDHPVNILTSIYETMPFAISNFANDVECVELQPIHEVTVGIFGQIYGVGLVEELFSCVVDIRFILYQRAHRKSMVHRFPQICVVLLISRGEQGRQPGSFAQGLLDGVEIRLSRVSIAAKHFAMCEDFYLDEAFVQPIDCFQREWVAEGQRIGT